MRPNSGKALKRKSSKDHKRLESFNHPKCGELQLDHSKFTCQDGLVKAHTYIYLKMYVVEKYIDRHFTLTKLELNMQRKMENGVR